jgi:hypothetical protein
VGYFSSLFAGQSPTLNAGIRQAGDISQFTTGQGKNLTSQAGSFFSDLMSGDPAKTARLLAPQIGEMREQGNQQKKTMAEFGTRSGGTASRGQSIDDKTRANIGSMISNLTGQAVSGGASMGQNLIDTGMKALGQQVDMSQQQLENWSNSIFGSALSSGISGLESFGLGKIPGMGMGKAGGGGTAGNLGVTGTWATPV